MRNWSGPSRERPSSGTAGDHCYFGTWECYCRGRAPAEVAPESTHHATAAGAHDAADVGATNDEYLGAATAVAAGQTRPVDSTVVLPREHYRSRGSQRLGVVGDDSSATTTCHCVECRAGSEEVL